MCYLTDFTASVTTAFSPMPTEPTTSHWPASSSACPQRRRAVTATAPKRVTQTKSGTLVLAAVGGWSPSRPSNPAASRGCGPDRQSASTAYDHHTAVAIPLHRFRPTPPFHRQRPPFADSDRQLRLRPAKPGASSTRSLRRSHPRWPKPAPRRSLNRRPIRNRQIRSSSAGKFPIDRHQRRRELPAVSSLEAFRTPASVQPLRPVTGRHPKTLNDSRPSSLASERRGSVESECGAVALGRPYLLPPLSSGGASLVRPWLPFPHPAHR